jgi:hypothetical protein
MGFFRVFFPFGNIALTARAGMDIYRAGYIGHGMLLTRLNRSRYVSLMALARTETPHSINRE